ncbi:MAG: NUDIX hydrolase [Rhizobiaceae bacterium]|nr:NUDIX hydrolase [Rhizobiaceae bacterium]
MTDVQSELDRIEKMINAPETRKLRKRVRDDMGYVRPRNASTMMLIDGPADNFKVLMGIRNKNLKFMPGALVFPGGSVDRGDGAVSAVDDLHPITEERLIKAMRGRPSKHAARALGLAAIRETAEESGLLMGRKVPFQTKNADWKLFEEKGISPSLAKLRLISRAITPPGMPRRFDTWFFAARADEIAFTPENGFDPCGELEGLQWLTPQEAIEGETREITRVMLVELLNRLKEDPELSPDYPVPYYFSRQGKFSKRDI